MNIYLKNTAEDPNIQYAGKILPRDKAPIKTEVPDKNIEYAGKTLPKDKHAIITPQKLSKSTNNPGFIVLSNVSNNATSLDVQLPPDTLITVLTRKGLVVDKILDGVSVIERIYRDPYEIAFECVLRMQNVNGKGDVRGVTTDISGLVTNVFAQEYLYDIWTSIWLPDTVLTVKNTYLNNIGINQIVVESCNPLTVRGSTNIPLKLRCYENIEGKSLIINSTNTVTQ